MTKVTMLYILISSLYKIVMIEIESISQVSVSQQAGAEELLSALFSFHDCGAVKTRMVNSFMVISQSLLLAQEVSSFLYLTALFP